MYTTWLERPKKALRVRGNLGPNNHSLLPEPVLRVPGATGTVGSTRRFEKIALRHGSLCLALVGFSHLIILCDRHCSSKRMYFCIFIVRLEIVLWLHKCIIFTEPFCLTDLESVYHILQILNFFMIITLVTTDLPNISGFVGSSLLHIFSISSLRGFRLFCTHRPSP